MRSSVCGHEADKPAGDIIGEAELPIHNCVGKAI